MDANTVVDKIFTKAQEAVINGTFGPALFIPLENVVAAIPLTGPIEMILPIGLVFARKNKAEMILLASIDTAIKNPDEFIQRFALLKKVNQEAIEDKDSSRFLDTTKGLMELLRDVKEVPKTSLLAVHAFVFPTEACSEGLLISKVANINGNGKETTFEPFSSDLHQNSPVMNGLKNSIVEGWKQIDTAFNIGLIPDDLPLPGLNEPEGE